MKKEIDIMMVDYIQDNFGFKVNKRNAKTLPISYLVSTLADMDEANIYLCARTKEGIKVYIDCPAGSYEYSPTQGRDMEWLIRQLGQAIYRIINTPREPVFYNEWGRQYFRQENPIVNSDMKYAHRWEWVDEEEIVVTLEYILKFDKREARETLFDCVEALASATEEKRAEIARNAVGKLKGVMSGIRYFNEPSRAATETLIIALKTYSENPDEELWAHIWKKSLGELNRLIFDEKLKKIYRHVRRNMSKVPWIWE